MKRIVLHQPGQFDYQTTDVPRIGKGMALVRIHAVGICGSDMHLYRKGHIGNIQMTDPLVIGHECIVPKSPRLFFILHTDITFSTQGGIIT